MRKKKTYNRTLADRQVRRVSDLNNMDDDDEIDNDDEEEQSPRRRFQRVRRINSRSDFNPNSTVPIDMDLADAASMPYNPYFTFYPGNQQNFPRRSYIKVRRANLYP